jgi:hypothetical protein
MNHTSQTIIPPRSKTRMPTRKIHPVVDTARS